MGIIGKHKLNTQELVNQAIAINTDLLLYRVTKNGYPYTEWYCLENILDGSTNKIQKAVAEKITAKITVNMLPLFVSTRFIDPFIKALSPEAIEELWKYLRYRVFRVFDQPDQTTNMQLDLRDYLILCQYLHTN